MGRLNGLTISGKREVARAAVEPHYLGETQGQWIFIQYDRAKGWVNRRFVVPLGQSGGGGRNGANFVISWLLTGGGRIQRQVKRAFVARPELTTAALAEWVYPRGRKPTTSLWRVRQEARRYADVARRIQRRRAPSPAGP
jgi:hypothetical protein